MKQIVITKYGDTDVLKIQEKRDPEPLPGEVLIKVKALGINFADILARKGPVSYTHLTLPTKCRKCRCRGSPGV